MERIDRIEAAILELQKSQAKTSEELEKGFRELRALQAKTDAQLAKTDAQLAKTDAQLAKSNEKWKETTTILSNIGINLGMVAEEFFYYSLKDKKTLGNIKFDYVDCNVHARYKKIEDEFDIVMYNGNAIAIIEVKHKVHPNIIEKLQTQKIENFKIIFPQYANYKFYLGIAGMSIPQETELQAQNNGIAVLRQKGDLMDIWEEHLTAY